MDVLPRERMWFPRVELDRAGRTGLRLRPAPPLGREVSVWDAGGDPRRFPRLKGPDLPVLTALRGDAVSLGADEALLTHDGVVVEG